MTEGRGRGRRPGDGAIFPGGDLSKLDRAIEWFWRQGEPIKERATARFLSINVKTIQRALPEGVAWTAYAAAVVERLDEGWRP